MNEKRREADPSKVDLLLERSIDPAYLEECTELLGRERGIPSIKNMQSLVVFRVGGELLALPSKFFYGVTNVHTIRKIPHRSRDILKGLVNMHGQLSLCIDLAKFMEIDISSSQPSHQQQKMVFVGQGPQKWVFLVDEILGLFSCDMESLSRVPVNIEKSAVNYLKGIGSFQGKDVSVIDEELLLYSLERRIA